MLDISQIMGILPHRFPFLLVDRVLELQDGERIVALKNVTINEPFFPGHFPGHPVMPGVLIIEAMAQAAGIMAYLASDEETKKKVSYFAGIDNARFKRPVRPGDQLLLEITTQFYKRGIWGVKGKATVDGKVVAEADLMATFAAAD